MYRFETVLQAFIAVLALIGSMITMVCSFTNGWNVVGKIGMVIVFLLVSLLNYLVIKEMMKGEWCDENIQKRVYPARDGC